VIYLIRIVVFFGFSFSFLLAQANTFQDTDLDGVDDRQDWCPNTPFDVLVDEHGCDETRPFPGKITFQIGIERDFDENYGNRTLINAYADYTYGKWDISLSTVNGTPSSTTHPGEEDDLFVTLGYRMERETWSLRVFGGTTFVFDDNDTYERDNDIYIGFDAAYVSAQGVTATFYYNYTFTGSATYNPSNYSIFSLGAGYYFTPRLYTACYYNYTGTMFETQDASHTLSIYLNYKTGTHTYVSASYTYGLNDAAYDHTLLLSVGVFY